jgi:glutamate 5-kinase
MSSPKRIVIKVGSQVLSAPDGGLHHSWLASLAEQIRLFKSKGANVVLVTSGAVALGSQALQLKPPMTMAEKQACAAVGQGRLMGVYEHLFQAQGVQVAQILVTAGDLSSRTGFINLKQTFETLLRLGVVPIVNENDSVSIMELTETAKASFGDNDKLSAIVATKLDADLLILVTNVDGIYTANPARDSTAIKLMDVENIQDLMSVNTEGQSELGRGGMVTKLEAAQLAAICGITTMVTNPEGLLNLDLSNFPQGANQLGTLIHPQSLLKGKKKWIGAASGFKGIVVINEGAKNALLARGASLLAVGIIEFQGDFQAGEVVSLKTQDGEEIARGISKLNSSDLKTVMVLPKGAQSPVVVHRDSLAVLVGVEK